MRMLHIEDSDFDAELISRAVIAEWPECQITRIESREELIEKLEKGDIDVIVSDFTLGALDGLEALELVRKRRPGTPFIFLSGTMGEDRAVEALRRGAIDYLLKDRPARLVPAIRNALAFAGEVERRKRVESQFLRAQRMESIGLLAGGIAHDLNNVLTPILMSLNLLRAPANESTRLAFIAHLEESARHGAALVRQLLDFARGADGSFSNTDLRVFLSDFLPFIESSLPKSITVVTRIVGEPPIVRADVTQLKQVLLNLCINARDAIATVGGITLSLERVDLTQAGPLPDPEAVPGTYAVLSVSDTGSGIPATEIDRIFDPFFTTKESGNGTGLGLSVVRGIVKGHGGYVTVDSEMGKGTVFRIFFPAHNLQRKARTGSTGDPFGLTRRPGILLVDDDPAVRALLESQLTTAGYRVLGAADGASGLELFVRHRSEIDAVFTDLQMAVMSGVEFIRCLRERDPVFPIVAISGLADSGRFDETLAKVGVMLLPKPIRREVLLAAAAKAVGIKRPA